jgi:integrase
LTVEARQAQRLDQRISAASNVSFEQAAREYIDNNAGSWRASTVKKWEQHLRLHAFPTLGPVRVRAINEDLVIECLAKIWTSKYMTAIMVQNLIERILEWCGPAPRKYRDASIPNPARWAYVKAAFGKSGHVITHRRALEWHALPAAWRDLNAITQERVAVPALKLLILTATRPEEAAGAQWREIDLARQVWTIPKERRKDKKELRVPLSTAAIELLTAQKPLRDPDGRYVFPGRITGGKVSQDMFIKTLAQLQLDCVPHGFRATFKTWAADHEFADELSEAAIGHQIGKSKVWEAYQRGDYFKRRRAMMQAYAQYVTTPPPRPYFPSRRR